jgi:outer membrane receptor protein involved in Fe transport
MTYFNETTLTFFLTLTHFCLLAQNPVSVTITGTVKDVKSDQPIPYSTVAVLSVGAEKILTGTTTDENGYFSLQASSTDVFLEISFIGFEKKILRDLNLRNGNNNVGTIQLVENAQSLNEVEVTTEKSSVEFKLDKRVFNVGKDISSSGMSAMDVLSNVPSVNVNLEGQVSLRGNAGVQILINGKPSVLSDDGSNILGTLTADMIESIEVITNPSAKYEAEGTSGIINIILKKEEKKGFNGSVSVNTGIPDNHSIGVSLNRRTEKFNFFTQFGAGYRSMPSFNENINRNLIDGTSIFSDGTEYRNEAYYNVTLGADYHINDLNVITLSGRFALEDEDQPSETDFSIYTAENELISQYRRNETTTAINPKYQYDLQYKRQFKNHEDHVLLFSALGSFFGKEQSSVFLNSAILDSTADPDQQTETNFYQRDFTYQLDYTNPLTKEISLELGAMYETNDVGNDYAVFNNIGNNWLVDSNLTNNFEFIQKVLGVYATGAYEGKKWGVKAGLRLENTDLNTVLTNTNEENESNYTNLFPSLHTSYKISPTFSVQAGYSKRIFRPRLWDLNPFFNIRNNYNIRRGNPNLQPEFADSYELTGIFIFQKVSLNSSIYHLYTTEVVERVSFYEDNVNITTPVNIGTRNQTGLEINGKYTPAEWLTLNGDFNYGYFSRTGTFENQDFDFTGDKWFARITTRFKLPAGFDLEFSGDYQSGFETVQGRVSGFAFADAGIRKKLWKGKAVLNLAVRDLFATRINENNINQPDFYLYNFSQRGRFITLGFSYSIGKGEAMTYSGK